MSSVASIAGCIGLGLTALLFDAPYRLGDVRLLAHGRLHLWDGWMSLADEHRQLVARFLGLRPGALAEDAGLFDTLLDVLEDASDFELVEGASVREERWSTAFEPVPGQPLEDRVEQWFAELERSKERAHRGASEIPAGDGDLHLTAAGRGYRVPRQHLAAAKSAPTTRATIVGPDLARRLLTAS